MKETGPNIDGRAVESALGARLCEGGLGQDFVDWLGHLVAEAH
jgi:hypothetical protein